MTACEVCGSLRFDKLRRETNIRRCCDHPEGQMICDSCYQGGKGTHAQHSGKVRKG